MDGQSPCLFASLYHEWAVTPFLPILKLLLQDQRGENRKSAFMELKGMLVKNQKQNSVGEGRTDRCFSSTPINSARQDKVKQQPLRAAASRRRMSRNVEEAELLRVLQRRRRVMEDGREPSTSTQTQGTLQYHNPAQARPLFKLKPCVSTA